MILREIPNEPLTIAKGSDVTLEFRIRRSETIKVTSEAATGATSISIDRDHPAFAQGDMFILSDYTVIECNATCAAGASSMTTTALPGPLHPGDLLQMLADLTGYTEELEVLTNRGDGSPVISLTGAAVTIPTQSAVADRGKVQFALASTDTVDDSPAVDIGPGEFYYSVWSRGSGAKRPQVEGTFTIEEKGQL